MKTTLAVAALLLSVATPAMAHRLDEYLQATVISIEKGRVQLDVRLAPGVAVLPMVLPEIDTNGDGIISEAEQRAYAGHVLRDLLLIADGDRVTLRLLSVGFPTLGEMREGAGEILLMFEADLRGGAANRSLTLENRHLTQISAYLVNSLVPRDPALRIIAQERNPSQSVYRLNYTLAGTGSDWSNWSTWGCLSAFAVLLCVRLAFSRRPNSFSKRVQLPG